MAASSDATLKTKRNRSMNWTYQEVVTLVQVWENRKVDIRSATRRNPIYSELSNDLLMFGFSRSSTEIRNKIENLIILYRKEKEMLRQTGEKYSKWQYYNLVKKIVDVDSHEMEDFMQECLYSDQDSWENEVETSPTAHIIKLSSSISGNASDSDDPNSSQMMVDSQAEYEERFFNGQPKWRKKRTEDILCGLLQEIQRANAHNERNDEEIISLLRESNELCKQQNKLLKLLINK